VIFIFLLFWFPFKTFLVFLVYVLDYTGSLPVSFPVQIIYCIVSYRIVSPSVIQHC